LIVDAAKYLPEYDVKLEGGFATDENTWSDGGYELNTCKYYVTNNIDTGGMDAECL
jgi:hypothetical protein